MHNFEYHHGELYCEQVPVSRLAKELGTPCYIYSHATLVRHFHAYDSAFKNIPHVIAFAMKANSNLAILRLMAKEGSGADIGLQVVRLALRAADRRGELTPLLSEVLSAFDHDPYQAVAWSEEARATDYAAFAPIVMRHANRGDPVGRRIIERAADAIGDLLDLFLARGIDRLSLVGGLADAIAPWLTPDLRGRLRRPDADAAAGALLVARRRLDLPERETDHEQASKFRV